MPGGRITAMTAMFEPIMDPMLSVIMVTFGGQQQFVLLRELIVHRLRVFFVKPGGSTKGCGVHFWDIEEEVASP